MAKEEKKPEAEDKKSEAQPTEEDAGKSRKKRLLIIAIGGGVALAAVGGGLTFFLAGGGGEPPAAQPGHEAEKTEGHAKEEGAKDKKDAGAAKEEGAKDKKDAGAAKEGEAKKPEEGHKEGEKGAQPDQAGKKEEGKDKKLEGVEFGCTSALKPFNINLGNPLENRFMRLEIALEHSCAEEYKLEIEKRTPQLRDVVISVAGRKNREFLLSPDGKDQLRKELHDRINQYMTNKIDEVYITDILIE